MLRASFLACVLLTGCAGYQGRADDAADLYRAGRFDEAAAAFRRLSEGRERFLAHAEAGTAEMTAASWDDALRDFRRAADEVRFVEDRMLLLRPPTGLVVQTGETGEAFERIQLHACMALCYLAQGNVDSALLRLDRARRLLEREERRLSTRSPAGGVTLFLTALCHEIAGEDHEAYAAYEAMQKKGLAEELVGPALVRLAQRLGHDDLERWVEAYGPPPTLPPDAAVVVVVAGVGLGPVKLRDPADRYGVDDVRRRPRIDGVRLRIANRDHAIRATELEQTARTAAALRAAGPASKGEAVNLHGWLTLPDSWVACRLFVPPGVQSLSLQAIRGETLELGSFEMLPGETMLVLARTIDEHVVAHVVGGEPLRSAAP